MPGRDRRESIDLCILATSDLHGTLVRPQGGGLAALAPLIRAARAGGNTIYLDNGDLFPEAAHMPEGAAAMVAALGLLGCDAHGPGNHDFDYGLDPLLTALERDGPPTVCANVRRADGQPLFERWRLLERQVTDRGGATRHLRIGVTAVLPPETAAWNAHLLGGVVQIDDMVGAARQAVAELRAAGTDLVVLLAHSGFALGSDATPDNRAGELAALPGVDVVVAGHTHRPHPGAGEAPPAAGAATVVNPGAFGTHLAQVDLVLRPGDPDRPVQTRRVRLRPAAEVPDPAIAALADRVAGAAAARLDRVIGRTAERLSTHFALVQADPVTALVNAAKVDFVRRALAGSRWADLPVLAAAAPFRAGGRGGVDNYVDVPPGALRRREVETIYGFSNRLVALDVTGRTLRHWLERSAGIFRQLQVGGGHQPLFAPGTAGHGFDVISGLSWEIDLAAPAMFDVDGTPATGGGRRIRDIQLTGVPLEDDMRVVLVTNSHRVGGGGNFPDTAGASALPVPALDVRDVLECYIAAGPPALSPPYAAFRFRRLSGVVAEFRVPARAISRAPPGLLRGPCHGDGFQSVHMAL